MVYSTPKNSRPMKIRNTIEKVKNFSFLSGFIIIYFDKIYRFDITPEPVPKRIDCALNGPGIALNVTRKH
jgi:hypothetical protein